MHGNITPIKPDKPVEPIVKHTIIALTNRSPARIKDDDWPITAEGIACYAIDGAPYGWKISIRVRDEKKPYYGRTLIYAKYHTFTDDLEADNDYDHHNQSASVGRMVSANEAMSNLWKHIAAVAEELRERILDQDMRKYVTLALDRCFANLPPHSE